MPWLLLDVLNTAVAFIVIFKNNAYYYRLWDGRKVWGGIVNASHSWTILVKDFIFTAHLKEQVLDKDLGAFHRESVHRYIVWIAALSYQMRANKPWEQHLKTGTFNAEF